jgi:hypothetical protein
MNAEIIARLQQSLSSALGSASTEELLQELAHRLGGLRIRPESAEGLLKTEDTPMRPV